MAELYTIETNEIAVILAVSAASRLFVTVRAF